MSICEQCSPRFPYLRKLSRRELTRDYLPGLQGTDYKALFVDKEGKFTRVTERWNYNFLQWWGDRLSPGARRNLELSRSKWATARNIEHHFKSLARLLVKLKLAVRNPRFDPNLKYSKETELDVRLCPIIITRPD